MSTFMPHAAPDLYFLSEAQHRVSSCHGFDPNNLKIKLKKNTHMNENVYATAPEFELGTHIFVQNILAEKDIYHLPPPSIL